MEFLFSTGHSTETVTRSLEFPSAERGSNQGFFRYLGNQALVSDLNISGAVAPPAHRKTSAELWDPTTEPSAAAPSWEASAARPMLGGIAGTNKSTGKIVKSTSRAVVMAVSQTGGIEGNNEGLIADSSNESSVNVDVLEPSLDLGGIDLGTLNLAKTVINRTNMGGIAGTSTGIISGCQNLGTIGYEHSGYNVGGIAGRQNGIVTNCENRGVIYGRGCGRYRRPGAALSGVGIFLEPSLLREGPGAADESDLGESLPDHGGDHRRNDGVCSDSDLTSITDSWTVWRMIWTLKAAVQSDMGNVKEITSQATAALDTIEQILSSYRADALQRSPAWRICQNFLTQMEDDFHTLEDQFDTLLNQTDGLEGTFDATGESAGGHLWIACPSSSTTLPVETIEAMLNMLDENVQKITDVMGQTSQQVEDLINSVDQAIRSDLDQLDHGGNLLQGCHFNENPRRTRTA